MDKRWVRKAAGLLFVFACVLLAACMPVKAATAWDDLEAVITIDRTFSPDENQAKAEAELYANQLLVYLEEAALKNGKLMNGTSYSYVIVDSREVTYRFDISPQFTKEVTLLTSEKSAYKKALRALEKRAGTAASPGVQL